MGIGKSIRMIQRSVSDAILYKMSHSIEVRKYRDPRRKAIADSYPLTTEQKEQIDKLYITNFGERIDYVWHQNYAAHANQFDYRFFPELFYIPDFERFQNQNTAACKMLSDKNFLPLIADCAKVRMPKTILSCTNGVLQDEDNHIITSKMGEEILKLKSRAFVKPTTDSCSGQGCMLMTENDRFEFVHNKLVFTNSSDDRQEYNNNFVVQEVVNTHSALTALHPESVNTFRIITYLWKDKIEEMPVILRIGRGKSNVDNAHAGGMFIAVTDDGVLGDHAVTEFNLQFEKHPDTGIIFKNYSIPSYSQLIEAAKNLHSLVPQIGVINWDFTIDIEGQPVLIEANINGGSVWLPQMAHGTGAFGDKTEEVLQWLRFMKKLKVQSRINFVGGRME